MAKKEFDELNILHSSDEETLNSFDYHDYIVHYFDPMAINERQRKKRIEAANDIFDAILLFFIWCENAPDKVIEEDTQRMFENLYKEVIFQHGEPDEYFDSYVSAFIPMLVTTTLTHIEEDYFTSIERAANVACNESNSVLNHAEHENAKLLGMTKKTWVTELDDKVRLSHQEMEGVTIPIDDYFVFDDCKMLFAHDAVNGTPEQIINCRCTTIYK